MNIDPDIYRKWLNAETDEERAILERAAENRNEIKDALASVFRPVNSDYFNVSTDEVGF